MSPIALHFRHNALLKGHAADWPICMRDFKGKLHLSERKIKVFGFLQLAV
jgi:hypothetical protein